MKPVANEIVDRQLGWRYATKKFDPSRPLSDEDWATLERSLVLAPSSFGLQPWKFVVVSDPVVKARLKEVSWNQAQIVDGSHVVVFAGKVDLGPPDVDRWIDRIAKVRGSAPGSLEGYRKAMLRFFAQPAPGFSVSDWAARQLYIALGQLMACAAMIGVDTCPMEGIDPAGYDRILGLEGGPHRTVVACVAGHRLATDHHAALPKVRFDASDVVTHVRAGG